MFTDRASFAADGNAIASDSTFLQLFPERKPDCIEVGLIKLKPDTDTEKVRLWTTGSYGSCFSQPS